MTGGYTNLDKVRPAGYRRFQDEAPPPLQQIPQEDTDDEEEAPPSYQRGGGPVFYPGPPRAAGSKSPTPPTASPTKNSGDVVRRNPGNLKIFFIPLYLSFLFRYKIRRVTQMDRIGWWFDSDHINGLLHHHLNDG